MKSTKQGEAVGYQGLIFFRNVGKHSPKGLKTRILENTAVGRLNLASIMVIIHRLRPCYSQTRLIPPAVTVESLWLRQSLNKLRGLNHGSLTEYSLFRSYNYIPPSAECINEKVPLFVKKSSLELVRLAEWKMCVSYYRAVASNLQLLFDHSFVEGKLPWPAVIRTFPYPNDRSTAHMLQIY
jgi:hypothetical protein